ncbi:MAG: phosphoenolpyruvate carboxykinase (ATP) [Geminicoccaceae bacterium]
MTNRFSLEQYGITRPDVVRNPAPAALYEAALREGHGSAIASSGALIAYSGAKTGRSPADKRLVEEADSAPNIWWGDINVKVDDEAYAITRQTAIDYLDTRDALYCIDAFVCWDPQYRIGVRVVCARPYHALFMHNMLIRPSREELASFGEPRFVIFNAGGFPANRAIEGVTSRTSVQLSIQRGELVILGTEYAGEMKKGVFTIANYLGPDNDILTMHCSATAGEGGDTSILFGLSGTGKTTLSADPGRRLIGDDEHGWSEGGIFNIEGGCYAKAIDLSPESEPDIYRAIRFGAVLENVAYDPDSHEVDYTDGSFTQNTRASYPIEFMQNAKIPCVGEHPKNVILLTCDAFGVLPPVSRLTPEQAMYHFISGYTAKVAGTEVGVDEPEAVFSPCFGGPFLVWHPVKYAEILADKVRRHGSHIWLVNTGWSGGAFGEGARIELAHTRRIIDAIHSGALRAADTELDPTFGFAVPRACPEVPAEILVPRNTWSDRGAYDQAARRLASMFRKNFARFEAEAAHEVKQGGPLI